MTRRRAVTADRTTLALSAALLGLGLLAGGPAAAEERGPAATGADRRFGLQGSPSVDGGPGAAPGWDSAPHRRWMAEFERGYRAGRAEERARHEAEAAAGRPDGTRAGRAGTDAQRNEVTDAERNEAYERLERAADELRRALVLMRRQPSLPRVQGALVQARQALEQTQNALTWLPPGLPDRGGERRFERLRGIGPERASGGWEG